MQATAIVIGGSIGTGKTTLAYKLKEYIEDVLKQDCAVLESDTERRKYLGFTLDKRLDEEHYSPEISEKVHEILDEKERAALGQGKWIIRALTGQSTFDYHKTKEPADKVGAKFIGIFLVASEETIRERLLQREHERNNLDELSVEQGHASDADAGVLEKYPVPDYVPEGWHQIDAEKTPEDVFEQAKTLL